jgi:hypothetical protein
MVGGATQVTLLDKGNPFSVSTASTGRLFRLRDFTEGRNCSYQRGREVETRVVNIAFRIHSRGSELPSLQTSDSGHCGKMTRILS